MHLSAEIRLYLSFFSPNEIWIYIILNLLFNPEIQFERFIPTLMAVTLRSGGRAGGEGEEIMQQTILQFYFSDGEQVYLHVTDESIISNLMAHVWCASLPSLGQTQES